MSRQPLKTSTLFAVAALTGLLPLAFGLAATDLAPADGLRRLLWGYGLASLPWLMVVWRWRDLPDEVATHRVVFGLGLALRLLLVLVPPLLSEDAWRYLWDGLVAHSGLNPYGVAPSDAALDSVAALSPAHGAVRAEVGHAHLPTVYPPLAQLGFEGMAALAGPRLWALRLALALGDALAVLALQRWLRRLGAHPGAAAIYAFAPLPMVEAAVGGHVEAWAVALMLAGLASLAAPKVRQGWGALWGGGLLGAAVATKLLPLMGLPALLRQAPRALLAVAAAVGLCALPYLDAGPRTLAGLSAYGARWRANAGAFDLLTWPFEQLWPAGPDPLNAPAWAVRLARGLVGTPPGVDPTRIWPDEAAFAAGKALALIVLALVWFWAWRRARTVGDLLAPTTLALCLLSPVTHPWYLAWSLALVVPILAKKSKGWALAPVVWVALAWLWYLPRIQWLSEGVWNEPVWSRALVCVPVWMVVVFGRRTRLNVGPKPKG